MHRRYYRKKKRTPLYLLLALACVMFSLLLISGPGPETTETAAPTGPEALPGAAPAPQSTAQPQPAPGTLLESGTDINNSYYKKLDFTGTASDLSPTSFVLGRERPATECRTGQDHPGVLTVHYGPDTVIKTARLYYPEDRFEIYMGSAADLKISPGYTFDVILEDAEAAELWAREIIVSTFVF